MDQNIQSDTVIIIIIFIIIIIISIIIIIMIIIIIIIIMGYINANINHNIITLSERMPQNQCDVIWHGLTQVLRSDKMSTI